MQPSVRYGVCVLVLAVSRIFAQSTPPPGTIDGATDPASIPDIVAFRLFFGALAETPPVALAAAPSPKLVGKLLPLNLNESDTTTLVAAVRGWQARVSPPDSTGGAAAPVDLDLVTKPVVDALRTSMTERGFASLLAYVRSEKRRMRRVPVPMTGHTH